MQKWDAGRGKVLREAPKPVQRLAFATTFKSRAGKRNHGFRLITLIYILFLDLSSVSDKTLFGSCLKIGFQRSSTRDVSHIDILHFLPSSSITSLIEGHVLLSPKPWPLPSIGDFGDIKLFSLQGHLRRDGWITSASQRRTLLPYKIIMLMAFHGNNNWLLPFYRKSWMIVC